MIPQLAQGDAREVLTRFASEGAEFDSCVTDPPYYLESIAKRFSSPESAPQKHGQDGRFARSAGGFHGQSWDSPDPDGSRIAQDPEFWALVLDLLKPGGFCLAFGGSRSGHRQAVAMEEAGFILHPMIPWVNGQGFPKGHSVSRHALAAGLADTPEEWAGWYGGTQALKPAVEPIYVAQRPFPGTMYQNVLKHGVGAFNIGETMVPGAEGEDPRWPPNLLHDGSPAVERLFPSSGGSSLARMFPAFPPALYMPKAKGAERKEAASHPTVKPVALLRWLVRLVTPRGGRVLDPFAGSGTTGVAAREEGMDSCLVERHAPYCTLIRQRLGLESPADLDDILGPAPSNDDLLGPAPDELEDIGI